MPNNEDQCFIPKILFKLQHNIPLNSEEKQYPLFLKYSEFLRTWIERRPTRTALEIEELIQKAEKIELSQDELCLLL